MADLVDPRKLLAEAIGVFTLVFVGAGAVVVAAGTVNLGTIEIALAQGVAIAVMMTALGHVSGGHFNPAVTAGFWVTRRLGSAMAAGYVMAQLAGGVLGGIALVVLFPEGLRSAANLGTPALGPTIDFVGGVGIEAVLTFILVLVFFGAAVDRRVANLGGVAVGLTFTMAILVAEPLTGGVINPARVFGPALLSGEWADHLVWWIGPMVGGVVAAMLYHYVFSDEADGATVPAS
jgi:MIP family channel proteins